MHLLEVTPRSPGTLRPRSSIQFSPKAPSGAWRPHPGDTFPRVPPAPGSPPSRVNESSLARDPEKERSAEEPSGLLRRVPATQAEVCAGTQGQRASFTHRESSSIRWTRSLRSHRSPGAAKSRSGDNETSRKERWGAIRRNRQHRRLTSLLPRFPGFRVAKAPRTAGPRPEGSAPRRAGDSRLSEHDAEKPAWPARSHPAAAPLPRPRLFRRPIPKALRNHPLEEGTPGPQSFSRIPPFERGDPLLHALEKHIFVGKSPGSPAAAPQTSLPLPGTFP